MDGLDADVVENIGKELELLLLIAKKKKYAVVRIKLYL